MKIELYFEVIEYSNEGFGKIPRKFSNLFEAALWVDDAQNAADRKGNPKELCYDVIPKGHPVYSTASMVKPLVATA